MFKIENLEWIKIVLEALDKKINPDEVN